MNTKNLIKNKIRKFTTRQKRTRAKIIGTAARPRLSVFRSNRHVWAQLIDDKSGKTLAVASDFNMKLAKGAKTKEIEIKDGDKKTTALEAKCALAYLVGVQIAQKAKALNVLEAVFDRGGSKYHGRVKGLAEGARSEGLKF